VVEASVSEVQGRRSFSPLVRNAIALMVSSVGSSGIGIVFWGVAAHLASVESIGRASAELSAMSLLASLASLSLGSTFIRFLPVSGDRTRQFVARSYGACASLAVILALVYVAAGLGHRFLPSGVAWRALFVVVVVFWVVFVLQDAALTGLRATKWVPVENLLFGLAKLALLPLFIVVLPKQGIFLAWSVPVFFAVAVVTRYLFRTQIPEHEAASRGQSLLPSGKEIASILAAQSATELVAIVTSMLMPLIVITRLGASASGHFYLPWTIAGSFALLIGNVLSSFLVEAAQDPNTMRLHVDRTVRLVLLILVPAVTIGVTLAPYLLRIFGATYAEHGTTLLRLLLLGLPGSAVTSFFASFLWLERRMLVLAIRQMADAMVFLVTTLLLIGRFGLLAVGIASLATEALQAVIFLPGAISRYRMVHSETGWKQSDAL
jgi:O-antigen/teichoic acid export membrane protein